MDFKKIFIKDASPTKIGGQAVLDGLMMRGDKSMAIVMRKPDGGVHLSLSPLKKPSGYTKIPIFRGMAAFVSALVMGTKILMYSAKVQEDWVDSDGEPLYEEDKTYAWLEKRLGEKSASGIYVYMSVILAVAISIGVFVVSPTAAVHFVRRFFGMENAIILNLFEGSMRVLLFVSYIALISKMPEIKTTFQYHGSEHKMIHCFENKLPLTAENAQEFYTVHPRCGTSFLMFVMVISLIIFSLLGWPGLLARITSRIILMPLVAGLSYELLRMAGRGDSVLVKFLSIPGLYLQKLTTVEPSEEQLEVAAFALRAVLPEDNSESLAGELKNSGMEGGCWVGEILPGGELRMDVKATGEYCAGFLCGEHLKS